MKKITMLAILLILMGCSNDQQHKGTQNSEHLSFAPQSDEELSPESQEIYHFLLAEIALDRDQPEVALKEYEALNKAAPDPLTAARATGIAVEQKDFKAAAESVKIWADAMPKDIQTQAIAASIELKQNDIDDAMPYMARLIDKDDQKTFDNLLVLRSTLEDKQHAKAFIELMDAYGTKNKDYRVLFMGADTAEEMKDRAAAAEFSKKITAINPNWTRGAVLRVQLQYEAGKIDEALASIAQLIKDNPNEGTYKYLQAKLLLEKGDLDSSLKALNSLKLDPKFRDEAMMDLARLNIQKKDYKSANEILNQYLVYEPNSDEAKYYSGFVAKELKQNQIAIQRLREVKPGMFYVNANIQLALLLSGMGQTDESLKVLNNLIQKSPTDEPRIDLVKIQVLLDSNRVEESYQALNKILTNDDGDVDLRYIRGLVAMELGHMDVAEGDFRYVIMMVPKHVEALNDLSAILIEQKNYDEAKYYIDQALAVAPNDTKAIGNLGWLMFLQGKNSEALTYLEKANRANEQDDVVAAHYGQALWQSGDKDKAMMVWNKALQANPNDPLIIKVMRDHIETPAKN